MTAMKKVSVIDTCVVRETGTLSVHSTSVTDQEVAKSIVSALLGDSDREKLLVLCLNQYNNITAVHEASVGGLALSIVEPRQVFKAAILSNAAAIILAHNHPSGNPEPSREDIRVTKQIRKAGEIMEIPLLDHVILAGDNLTSLAARGHLS